MMTTWKYEGRSAILLMTFMVQTLLIIIGVGAVNSTVVATSLTKSVQTYVQTSVPPVSSAIESQPTSSLAKSSVVIQSESSQDASTSTPIIQTSSVINSAMDSSPQTSIAISFTSPVSGTVTPSTQDLKTTGAVVSSSQTSIATSFTSPVSGTVTPSIQDLKTTGAVVSPPQTSVATLFTSPVSVTVTPSIQDLKTTSAVVSPSQTSVTASFTSSVSINATAAPPRPFYIKMTFKMPWGRLCFLLTLFKEALSDDLIEMKDLGYERVNPARIKLMNKNEKCENKTHYFDKAVLKLYISNSTKHLDTVDKNMTIEAFQILYGYWVNRRMILLDKVFEGKVEKVELIGAAQDKYIEKYTEAQRIGIGIGAALAVVALILLIYYCVMRCCRRVKSVGHSTEESRMIFTNTVAINEEATADAEDSSVNTGSADTPWSDLEKTDEPEEVVIHTQPVAKTQDEMPLLSVIKDFEDGQKVDQTESNEKPNTDKAPLAKPEPDNVSEGEPIKSIDEPEPEPIKTPDEPEGKPANEYETVADSEDAPPVTEKPPETGEDTVTSSVTIVITPESSPATIEFPVPEPSHEPAEDDHVKPDFGQSDNIDVDPNQGAINMAFDDNDEATDEGDEEEEDEETKF